MPWAFASQTCPYRRIFPKVSYIPKQEKHQAPVKISIQLRKDIADQAKLYAEYLDSDLDHVVEQLLLKAFRDDKDFKKIAPPEPPKKTAAAGE